jgi:hypothetical protein
MHFAGFSFITTFTFSFSIPPVIHHKLPSNTCRQNHETLDQEPEIAHKILTKIDRHQTGVTTHRWMRKRCSKGLLAQGASSLCLMANKTSNTVTRRHTSNSLPAPPSLIYLTGSTSYTTQLISTAKSAVISTKYYPQRQKILIAVSISIN